MKRALSAFLLSLSLACTAQEVPPNFRGAQAEGTSIGELKWFEIFQDPQLQTLIRTALERNPDLLMALARVEAARGQLGITGAAQYPAVGLGIDLNQTRVSTTSPTFVGGFLPRERTFGEVLLNFLNFELDIWGRVRHQTEAAAQQYLASDEDRKTVTTLVVSEVATAYFNLLDLDAELDIAQRTLATREEYRAILQARMDGGIATLLDVRQGEQLVIGARLAVTDTQRLREQVENNLNLLLGNTPGPVTRGQSLLEQYHLPAVPAGLPSELLTRRPDIRSAEMNMVAQGELLEATRAAYFPRLSLTGFFGYQSKALSNLFTAPSQTFGLVPLLSTPILAAGRGSDIDQAEANRRLAQVAYQKTVLTAFTEVSNALNDYAKFHDTRSQRELLVATLQDRSKLAILRYKGGIDTMLNALDAERDLFEAQLLLTQARRNELLSLVQLYKALGGGWQP